MNAWRLAAIAPLFALVACGTEDVHDGPVAMGQPLTQHEANDPAPAPSSATPAPAATTTADSAPPPAAGAETASCEIKGDDGTDLVHELDAKDACASACLAQQASHPSASCLWGTADLAPTGSCHLTNINGGDIVNDTESRGTCQATCTTQMPTHPNETCMWGTVNITPTAECVITSVLAQTSDTTQSRGACLSLCTSGAPAACTWNGASILPAQQQQ